MTDRPRGYLFMDKRPTLRCSFRVSIRSVTASTQFHLRTAKRTWCLHENSLPGKNQERDPTNGLYPRDRPPLPTGRNLTAVPPDKQAFWSSPHSNFSRYFRCRCPATKGNISRANNGRSEDSIVLVVLVVNFLTCHVLGIFWWAPLAGQ